MVNDTICLTIPSKADYISIVRLAASGIGNNINLNIDEIEDIKVCVGEACINALNQSNIDEISVKFTIMEDKIVINVADVLGEVLEESSNSKEVELGLVIIKSLMDEVEFSLEGIEMIKYIE